MNLEETTPLLQLCQSMSNRGPDSILQLSTMGQSTSSKKSAGDEILLDTNEELGDLSKEYVLDKKRSRLKPTQFVYLCTCLACLSSILLGYDIGQLHHYVYIPSISDSILFANVLLDITYRFNQFALYCLGIMSGAIVYMEHDLGLSQWRKEVIISSLNLFSIIGALFGGHISQSIGRKRTVAISAVIFLIATRIFAVIVCGRILLGIASGTGLLIAPLYSAELAPSNIRGKLVTFAEISIYLGILLGYFIAWCFTGTHDDDVAWRLMIGFGIIPAIILFVSMLIMPESPRWLIEHGKDNEAFNVLYNVYGDNKQLIHMEMKEIQITIKMENQKHRIQQMTSSKSVGKVDSDVGSGWTQWKEVLCPKNEYIKRALLIGIGVSFFQQASGNEAAVYYTPHIFREAGVAEDQLLLYTMFVGAAKTSVVIISALSLDKVGRRPLLLASACCTTLALMGLALAFYMDSYILTVVFQCLFQGSVSIGWGPVTWVMMAEIFPLQIRSKAMAICTTVNRLVSGTVALTFLSLQGALTPYGTWLMFAGISLVSVVFIWKFVPETKQKTLEEITQFLMKNYTNTGKKGERSESHSKEAGAVEDGDIGLDIRK